MKKPLVSLLVGGLITLHLAFGATVNVPSQRKTIQAAIDAANNGDTVLVSPGIYKENIDFKGKSIALISSGGPIKTIIDGGGLGAVVTFQTSEGPNSQLIGFTIRNGSYSWGGGVTLSGTSPVIVGNYFRGNMEESGGFGAAIGGNGASPFIARNLFEGNGCDGQYLSGVVSFVNSSSPVIVNNILRDNPCRAINMVLPQGPSPVVTNNTIVRNPVGIRMEAGVPSSLQIYENNILAGNQVGFEVDFGSSANYPIWKNNLVYGGTNYSGIADQTGTNGNISLAPKLLAFGDFHEQFGSPAIGAGDTAAPGLQTIDFDGNPRIQSGTVDLGAYEFFPAVVKIAPTALAFGNQSVGTTSSAQEVTVTNPGASVLFVEVSTSGEFHGTSSCGKQLSPGASCTIEITFSPTQTGALAGKVLFSDNAKGSQQTVKLSGTGT